MTGFEPPDPNRPFTAATPNPTLRALLRCPRCGQQSIRAQRMSDRTFALQLKCVENCGVWGVFEPPDPQAWGFTPVDAAARIFQAWLNDRAREQVVQAVSNRQPPPPPPSVETAAGPHGDKDREIERLRSELAKIADLVHSLHHPAGQWSDCGLGLCSRVRKTLGLS